MTHHEQIARNPRLLFWARAFLEVKALTAVIVLFYLHRGVGQDEVFWLSIAWSITALLTEVPSGYLADRIGRKRTMIFGAMLLAFVYVIEWYAQGFWQFVPIFVLMSAAFSCFSGTEEALLYESLLTLGREEEMTHKNGRLFSARSMFKIFIPFIGAFIASDLLEWQFKILIAVNAFALLIALLLLMMLREPKHRKDVLGSEIGIFRQSIETIKHEPWLVRVALNRILVFVAIFVSWRVYQPLLTKQAGMAVEWLGVFDLLSHIVMFAGGWFLGRIDKYLGTKRVVIATAVITAVSLLIAGFASTPWILFVTLLAAIAIGSTRAPVFAKMLNQEIESRSRATTLSNLNVMKSVLDIPILLLAGWLAAENLQWPIMLGVVICVIAIAIFPYKRLK